MKWLFLGCTLNFYNLTCFSIEAGFSAWDSVFLKMWSNAWFLVLELVWSSFDICPSWDKPRKVTKTIKIFPADYKKESGGIKLSDFISKYSCMWVSIDCSEMLCSPVALNGLAKGRSSCVSEEHPVIVRPTVAHSTAAAWLDCIALRYLRKCFPLL